MTIPQDTLRAACRVLDVQHGHISAAGAHPGQRAYYDGARMMLELLTSAYYTQPCPLDWDGARHTIDAQPVGDYTADADAVCNALRALAADPDALDDLHAYLRRHYAAWAGRLASDPAAALADFTSKGVGA